MSRHELDLQKKIVAYIKKRGGVARICTQIPPYTTTGDPDVYGVYLGKMLQLEVKDGDFNPTGIQLERLREWRSGGAWSDVVRNLDHIKSILEMIDASRI